MVKKIGIILIKKVIFTKGLNYFTQWQNILASLAGLSCKELATLGIPSVDSY
jgi:hypothetical protein